MNSSLIPEFKSKPSFLLDLHSRGLERDFFPSHDGISE